MRDNRPWGDAVVTGYGTVFGRKVFVFSQDFTVFGGSLSEVFAEKVCKVMDMAVKYGCPADRDQRLGRRAHPGRRRVARGLRGDLLAERAGVRRRAADLARDGAVRRRRRLLARDHRLRAHGRGDVVHVHHRPRRREDGDRGGRDASRSSAVPPPTRPARAWRTSRPATRTRASRRRATSSPSSRRTTSTRRRTRRPSDPVEREDPSLDTLVPDSPNKPYDIKGVIERVVDDGDFLEVHAHWAENIVCGFARLGGHAVGVVGNQPGALAGVLDIDASVKAARFVRTCDAFNIPLVTFVDVPGFLPGTAQEWGGIIRHGAKLLYAYAEATVPKLTVITRKAYGGAYDVMSSKHIRADFNVAWPTAEVAVMGPEGAVNIVFRTELAEAGRSRRAARRADRGLQGAVREPVHGCRARVRRRRHRAATNEARADLGARDGALEARAGAEAQAREHPALDRQRGDVQVESVRGARLRRTTGLRPRGARLRVARARAHARVARPLRTPRRAPRGTSHRGFLRARPRRRPARGVESLPPLGRALGASCRPHSARSRWPTRSPGRAPRARSARSKASRASA